MLEFGLPRQPAFRALYLWYSHRLLPAVGRLVSKHASAYEYLPESVARFPPPEEFGRMLQQSGFQVEFSTIEGIAGADTDWMAVNRLPGAGHDVPDFVWAASGLARS